MTYFQKHLRNYMHPDSKGGAPPLRNKKLNCQRIKTEHSSHLSKRNKGQGQLTDKNEYHANHHLQRKSVRVPSRFATEGPAHQQPVRNIFAEADNSMEEMLNSSMNHFEEYLLQKDSSVKNNDLVEQNEKLKEAVQELKHLLKVKLDKALKKQEQELKGVLSDYLQLITKLLADKQSLTQDLEQAQKMVQQKAQKIQVLQGELGRYKQSSKEKQELMNKYIQKLQEQLQTVDESQLQDKLSEKNTKIQTLYEILQKSEEDKKKLQQMVSKLENQDSRYKMLEEEFEHRLEEKESQFEEIFEEYDKAMKETVKHKDNTISRLNRIIQNKQSQDSSQILSLSNSHNC